MPNDLHNLNEALAEIERVSVETSAGRFVKVEDVKRIMVERTEQRLEERVEAVGRGRIKTPEQARAAVRRDEEIMKGFRRDPQEPGRSVPATEPQPSSRT